MEGERNPYAMETAMSVSTEQPPMNPPAKLKRQNTSVAYMVTDPKLQQAIDNDNKPSFCTAFSLNFIMSLIILGEELCGLFFFDSDEFSERDFFWVIFGYTVAAHFLECAGLCSVTFERIITLLLEATQCGLFIYFSGFTMTAIIIFSSFFGAQIVLTCITEMCGSGGEDQEETDEQKGVAIAQKGLMCYSGVFQALCSISLIYYDKKSPFRQNWYEIIIIINIWLSTFNLMMATVVAGYAIDPATSALVVQKTNIKYKIDVTNEEMVKKLPLETQQEIGIYITKELKKRTGAGVQEWLQKITNFVALGFFVVMIVAQIIYFPKADKTYDIVMCWISFVSVGIMCCGVCCLVISKCLGMETDGI